MLKAKAVSWTPIRNKNYKGTNRHQGRNSMRGAEFIAWDGEGTAVDEPIVLEGMGLTSHPNHVRHPQPYVLLANNKDQRIINNKGLDTQDCFEFLLETKQRYLKSIFVGYGLNYDINQMLKGVPPSGLRSILQTNRCHFGPYRIEWFPGKWLDVSSGRGPLRRSFILYDVLAFFQKSFLATCQQYLGKEDPDLSIIEAGKAHREAFTWEELDDFIIPYNKVELVMLVRVMNALRSDLAKVGVHPDRWHGPGAVANKVLSYNKVKISRDIPQEVSDAATYAYAGGRFEQFWMGRYADTVYEYDIHSAYPAALARLPDLSEGTWEHATGYEPGAFGVWRIEYQSPNRSDSYRPQPLFCRAQNGAISYPRQVSGWYWSPEAELCPGSVIEGFVFRPATNRRPFRFVEKLYTDRRHFKEEDNPIERAIKLILNSLYGKLAQTVGGKGGPPHWHQLEYAGYVTSYVRAMIYRAIMLNPYAIIAAETDAVFSIVPLDLTLSDNLGDWELKEHDGIIYLQSGFYYAGPEGVVCRYRGMDRDRETGQPAGLPYRTVVDHLSQRVGPLWKGDPPLPSYSTRFIGLALGMQTDSVWRSWERKYRFLSLDQDPWSGKRYHLRSECRVCQDGRYTLADRLHPMQIGGYDGKSYPRRLPWVDNPDGAPIYDFNEWLDEYGAMLKREEQERWNQPT